MRPGLFTFIIHAFYMKTVLLTTICFLGISAAWISCKKDNNPVAFTDQACSAKTPFIFKKGASELVLPDAFTPNGDGHNDAFRAIYKNIDTNDFRLTVFKSDMIFYSNTHLDSAFTTYQGVGRTDPDLLQVSLHFRTLDGTVIDTCSTITVLYNDPVRGCLITNGVNYHFEDQINFSSPAGGFLRPSQEAQACP